MVVVGLTCPIRAAGDIPSFKLFESEKVFAFLDIQPLSRGHAVSSPCCFLPRTGIGLGYLDVEGS